MRRWFRSASRTTGRPTSANGASSFHLWWGPVAAEPLVQVAATLEILDRPAVPALYFWALQVTFHDGVRSVGAAHLGLQWYAPHPGSTAVNFGGYRTAGGELPGSVSSLPSATGNPNTRDYPWEPGRPYRLLVERSGPESWRGSVTDLASGAVTAIRDLHAGGDRLRSPVVWAEVFARCDDPTVRARWRDLTGVTPSGATVRPERVRVTYQSHAAGGCDNTTVLVDGDAVVQVTNRERVVPPEATLVLSGPPGVA